MIRTLFLLGSVCAAFWQAPRLIALVDQVRTHGGLRGLNPANAFGGTAAPADAAANLSLDEMRSLISGAAPTAKPASKAASEEVVIFSPNMARLTEQERQRLRKQAESQRPDHLRPAGATPGEIGRVSLPPGARPAVAPSAHTPPTAPNPPTAPEGEPTPSKTPETQAPDPGASGAASPQPREGAAESLSHAQPREEVATTPAQTEADAAASDPLAGYGDGPPMGPVGLHQELRDLLLEIAPPIPHTAVPFSFSSRRATAGGLLARRGHGEAWRALGLPPGTRPTFIIGAPRAAARDDDAGSP